MGGKGSVDKRAVWMEGIGRKWGQGGMKWTELCGDDGSHCVSHLVSHSLPLSLSLTLSLALSSTCPQLCLPVCLPLGLPLCLSLCLPLYLRPYLSLGLPLYVPPCLPLCFVSQLGCGLPVSQFFSSDFQLVFHNSQLRVVSQMWSRTRLPHVFHLSASCLPDGFPLRCGLPIVSQLSSNCLPRVSQLSSRCHQERFPRGCLPVASKVSSLLV